MRASTRNVIATLAMICWSMATQAVGGESAKSALSQKRLWDKEPSLWEAAQSVTVSTRIHERYPDRGTGGLATNLSNSQVSVVLWGPPARLTLNLRKTDVWDRRMSFDPIVTLDEIRRGAFDERNQEEGEIPVRGRRGYLSPDGGRALGWGWHAYEFPMQKPVGQVIVSLPDFDGAEQPDAVLHCRDGTRRVHIRHGRAEANLIYLTMMPTNIIALKVDCRGLSSPVSVRLYRHRDTCEQRRPREGDPRSQQYAEDAAWNGPIDPPRAGKEDRFFWIRQKMPAEKTFPDGFEYVLMGLIAGETPVLDTIEGQRDLGTPACGPPDIRLYRFAQFDRIRQAAGSAATAGLPQRKNTDFTALVTVVTTNDGHDLLGLAKRRLVEAEQKGMAGLMAENAAWFKEFYARREDGRIFDGTATSAAKQIPEVAASWGDPHYPYSKPDPFRYEADSYGCLGDNGPWHCLPCYNEFYYTHFSVLNQCDRLDYYWKLVNYWLKTCRKNARDVFGLPGMFLAHGYLPPIKADDVYPHTIYTWEFCMEIPAQVIKTAWDIFDYGGDERFLAEEVYPPLRELAVFYAAYARKGDDGFYHVIPTVSAEHWGWTYRFERNRDSASALSMFKWTLKRAAQASEILGVDADLRDNWRRLAAKMAPYPTYPTDEGPVFTDVREMNPIGVDYNFFAGVTPTLLADEINLDSDPNEIQIMLRTARLVKGWCNYKVFHLLGDSPDLHHRYDGQPERLDDHETLMRVLTAQPDFLLNSSQPERLLNSRSGWIHLFPCVPEGITVGFRRLQARGGFAVSAERIEGRTTHVLIESRRNVWCRLANPWPGSRVTLYRNGRKSETLPGPRLEFKTAAGERTEVLQENSS